MKRILLFCFFSCIVLFINAQNCTGLSATITGNNWVGSQLTASSNFTVASITMNFKGSPNKTFRYDNFKANYVFFEIAKEESHLP